MTTQPVQVTVQLRLYSGGGAPLPISREDIWLALGYEENPQGPRISAESMMPFELLPGQAADVTLMWPWADETFGLLNVGERQFGMAVH